MNVLMNDSRLDSNRIYHGVEIITKGNARSGDHVYHVDVKNRRVQRVWLYDASKSVANIYLYIYNDSNNLNSKDRQTVTSDMLLALTRAQAEWQLTAHLMAKYGRRMSSDELNNIKPDKHVWLIDRDGKSSEKGVIVTMRCEDRISDAHYNVQFKAFVPVVRYGSSIDTSMDWEHATPIKNREIACELIATDTTDETKTSEQHKEIKFSEKSFAAIVTNIIETKCDLAKRYTSKLDLYKLPQSYACVVKNYNRMHDVVTQLYNVCKLPKPKNQEYSGILSQELIAALLNENFNTNVSISIDTETESVTLTLD